MEESASVLAIASWLSALLPLLLCVVRRSHLADKVMALLASLLVISFVCDALGLYMMRIGLSDRTVVTIYCAAEFLILSLIYSVLMPRITCRIYMVAVAGVCFFLGCLFLERDQAVAERCGAWLQTLICLGYSVAYVTHLNKTLPTPDIGRYTPFWINGAVLVYFGFGLFLLITTSYDLTDSEKILMGAFHDFNTLVRNLLFATAIYFSNKKHTAIGRKAYFTKLSDGGTPL